MERVPARGVARNGTATVFPQAIAMAAAFDEELIARSLRRFPTKPGRSTMPLHAKGILASTKA